MLVGRFLFMARVTALVFAVGLASADQIHAQTNAKPVPVPAGAQASATAAAKSQLRFQEAEAIRKAILLLQQGDKDYKGHRANAVKAAKAAAKILDDQVMKSGNPQVKAVTNAEKATVKKTDQAEKLSVTVHETQASSDTQLKNAGELLAEVRKTLAQNKQPKVLAHVDTAIKEIETALAIK